MEKAQVELFRAIRSGDLAKARRAYEKGANVNWPLDKWMIGGRQHWGLRVQVKPLGIYLGFSAREAWRVPDGHGADRGDTLVMVALKCGMRDAAAFLLGCDRLNLNCLNEAGNSAADIARATGQEFLMRGAVQPPAGGMGGGYEEAVPEWEQGVRPVGGVVGGGAGGSQAQYVPVVAEAVAIETSVPVYATAQVVGETDYARTGHATAAPVHVATAMQPSNNPVGRGGQQHNPYNPADGGGRANVHHAQGRGAMRTSAVFGAF